MSKLGSSWLCGVQLHWGQVPALQRDPRLPARLFVSVYLIETSAAGSFFRLGCVVAEKATNRKETERLFGLNFFELFNLILRSHLSVEKLVR